MRIVIDMQGAQSTGSWNRGIGRYTMSLALAMVRNCEQGDEIVLALNAAFPESIARIRENFIKHLPAENIKVWGALKPASHLDPSNNWRRQTGELVREAFLENLNPDFVLLSSLFEGLGDDALTSIRVFSGRFLTASILYDLIPLVHKKPYLENPVVEAWYLEKIEHLKRADLWLAISESSSQEGVSYLNLPADRCINISTDADVQFKKIEINHETEQKIRSKYNLQRPFIMYTGGIDHRKNIEGLIRAYALLPVNVRKGHQLAIVCSVQDHARNSLQLLADKAGLKEHDLILTGFVPEEDLIALYNLCAAFIFPSWHEGFGLPALEAMRCGAPVIAANSSSLPEVVGLDDALFDPHSDQDIASSIERVLTDNNFREKLIAHAEQQAKLFSWDLCARRALHSMRQLKIQIKDARESSNLKTNRPRLAYISPLPPMRSGIADYSAELLPALAKHYEIEVIVAQEDVDDAWIAQHIPVRSVEWFAENIKSFDRVLYHFGNSEFHRHMVALLGDIPGVVVLHDFYLSGALHYMSANGYPRGIFEEHLFKSHGYAALIDKKNANSDADVIWKYPCSRFVFEDGLGTIVHSANSARLAYQWFGLSRERLAVIPHMRELAASQDRSAARKSLDLPENGFVVCSFGMLGPTKLNHRLLSVWLGSEMAKTDQCRLVFVGENQNGEYGEQIQSLINNHPNGKSVSITGWVDQEGFRSFLSAADVGVQLRALSRGETSGTVLDCMNYGLATIINANGSMADINDASVWKIPDDFTDQQLLEALHKLWEDEDLRKRIGNKAKAVIKDEHDPQKCADQYKEALERFYVAPKIQQLVCAIADIKTACVSDGELAGLATEMASLFPLSQRARTLLVDISCLLSDGASKLKRKKMLNALREWVNLLPAGWRFELVYVHENGICFYAREFSKKLFGISSERLRDEPIDYASGDVLLVLECNSATHTQELETYQSLRGKGLDVRFASDRLPSFQQIFEGRDQSAILN